MGFDVPADATVLTRPVRERLLLWIGFPLVGLLLGRLLPIVAAWAVSLPWVPFQAPLELLVSLPAPVVTFGGLGLGGLAGLVLALVGEAEYVRVAVGDGSVQIRKDESERTVDRASVSAVFLDGKHLVLLGSGAEELVHQCGDLPRPTRLAEAFRRHGYPWCAGGDPHRDEFRRWVTGLPELSSGAHALLAARSRALENRDADDAEQLRRELAAIGVVVRDTDGRQYWRSARPAPEELGADSSG